jgi:hypothetical protein
MTVKQWLALSHKDRQDFIDPRIAIRREREERWVADTLRDAVANRKP